MAPAQDARDQPYACPGGRFHLDPAESSSGSVERKETAGLAEPAFAPRQPRSGRFMRLHRARGRRGSSISAPDRPASAVQQKPPRTQSPLRSRPSRTGRPTRPRSRSAEMVWVTSARKIYTKIGNAPTARSERCRTARARGPARRPSRPRTPGGMGIASSTRVRHPGPAPQHGAQREEKCSGTGPRTRRRRQAVEWTCLPNPVRQRSLTAFPVCPLQDFSHA